MARVIVDARDPLDHLGHPAQRPELGGVAVGAGALQQRLLHPSQLSPGQLRRSAGARRLFQRLQPAPPPAFVPATGALPADLQDARHVGLGVAFLEELSGASATAFLSVAIGLRGSPPRQGINGAGT